jgi:hypothetical protein
MEKKFLLPVPSAGLSDFWLRERITFPGSEEDSSPKATAGTRTPTATPTSRRRWSLLLRAMKKYGDPFPETPELKIYVEEWLTREVRPE